MSDEKVLDSSSGIAGLLEEIGRRGEVRFDAFGVLIADKEFADDLKTGFRVTRNMLEVFERVSAERIGEAFSPNSIETSLRIIQREAVNCIVDALMGLSVRASLERTVPGFRNRTHGA